MVERASEFSFLICLAIVCPIAHSMELLQGPAFLNSSDVEVSLFVSSKVTSQELLRNFPARQIIAVPGELRVKSIYVFSGEKRYELDEESYMEQSAGLSQRRQLWIFDGSRFCVRDIDRMKGKPRSLPTCEVMRVPR